MDMLNYRSLPLIVLVALAAVSIACAFNGPTEEGPVVEPPSTMDPAVPPTPDLTLELPFEGVWQSDDGRVLVLTPTTYYLHELLVDTSREEFAAVVEYDLDNQHILILLSRIAVMGQDAGFDFPQRYLTYRVEDGTLFLTTSSEGYPAEAGELVFMRQ